MASLTAAVALSGLSVMGLAGYVLAESTSTKGPRGDVLYLQDGSKIESGTTVKLNADAVAKYPGKGLAQSGSNLKGIVQFIDRTDQNKPVIHVTNTVRTRRFTDTYSHYDFKVLLPAREDVNVLPITNGMASVGTRVRYAKSNTGTENSSPKALGNPFYNSVGTVESVDLSKKLVSVKAVGIKDARITYTQDYNPSELIFVSLPYDEDNKGITTESGFINVGTRVSLTSNKYKEYKKADPKKQRFLASDEFEKVGVVQSLTVDNDGKHTVVVKCKHINSTQYYDQEYGTSDLEVVGSDGIPVGTVFIFGGIADQGVKVKLREEKKEESAGKCLSRSTYGYTGIVDDVDPSADDNLKVQVRCVGSKQGEETSDWYEPEHLELADMPTDQGIPIFGGFATVGGVVEVMIDARGIKCLGKPSIGNVGVVMGIDSNAANGETLSIKCGRDMKTNTKVTNWYKPTDVKIYTPIDMAGTELDRLEAQLVMKRSELVKKQQEKAISAQQKADKITSMNMITLSITDLEKKIAALKTKGTNLEGMRDLYNRLSEDLAKFRKITATLDEEYNLARLDTSCNDSDVNTETALRRESEQLVDRYFEAIDDPAIQAIVDDPTYIKDVPSSDPEILRTLERDADQAVEVANKEEATEVQKTAADDALTRLKDFKKQRQFQGPKTDLQQAYIRKRDVLIAALRGLPRPPIFRRDVFALMDATIPGQPALNAIGTPTEKYKAYLDLKLAVETAMRTNPADPIQFVTDSGNAAAAAINLITDALSAQDAITASGGLNVVAGAVPTPLEQAGLVLNGAVQLPARPQADIKLAAYDVLVAAVESQPTTIDDLYIDKLMYENTYKNFARSAYSSDLTRSYDTQDVMLRNVNRARNIFDEFIQANPADPRNVAFRALANAFQNFIKAKQEMADEVHGNTTLVEKRIVLIVDDKKSKLRDLFQKGREMVVAQDKYDKAVTEEKTAEFYLTNALLKRDAEKDLYLRRESGQPGQQPGQPGVPNPPGTGKKRRRRGERPQFGGAITSEQRILQDYLGTMMKNYTRINHYLNILQNVSRYVTRPILFPTNRNLGDQHRLRSTIINKIWDNIRPRIRHLYESSNDTIETPPRYAEVAVNDLPQYANDIVTIGRQKKLEKDTEAKRLAGIPAAAATAATAARKVASDTRMADIRNTATGIATATYDVAARTAAQSALEELRKLRGGGMRGGAKVKAMIEYELLVKEVQGAITAGNVDPVGYAATNRLGVVPPYVHPPALDKLNAFRTPLEKLNAYRALVQAVEKARRIDPENPILEAEILIERTAPTIVPISAERPYAPAATAQDKVKRIADTIKPIYESEEDPDKKAVLKMLMDSANFSVAAASQYKKIADDYNRIGKVTEAQFEVKKIEEQEHRAILRQLLAELVDRHGKQKYLDTLFEMRTEVTKNPRLYQRLIAGIPFGSNDQLYLELFKSTAEAGNTQYALERLDELIDQYSAVFPIVDRYRDTAAARISETVPVVDQAIKTGSVATGRAAKAAAQGIATGAVATGQAIKTGAVATGQAIKTGAVATGRAIKTGAEIIYQASSVLSTRDAILLAKVRAKRDIERAGEFYADIRDRINQITGNDPQFADEFQRDVIDVFQQANDPYLAINRIKVLSDDNKDTRIAKIQQAELLALQAEELSQQCIQAAETILAQEQTQVRLQRRQEFLRRAAAAQATDQANIDEANAAFPNLIAELRRLTTQLGQNATQLREVENEIMIQTNLCVQNANAANATVFGDPANIRRFANAARAAYEEAVRLGSSDLFISSPQMFEQINERIFTTIETYRSGLSQAQIEQLTTLHSSAEEINAKISVIDARVQSSIREADVAATAAENRAFRAEVLPPAPPEGDEDEDEDEDEDGDGGNPPPAPPEGDDGDGDGDEDEEGGNPPPAPPGRPPPGDPAAAAPAPPAPPGDAAAQLEAAAAAPPAPPRSIADESKQKRDKQDTEVRAFINLTAGQIRLAVNDIRDLPDGDLKTKAKKSITEAVSKLKLLKDNKDRDRIRTLMAAVTNAVKTAEEEVAHLKLEESYQAADPVDRDLGFGGVPTPQPARDTITGSIPGEPPDSLVTSGRPASIVMASSAPPPPDENEPDLIDRQYKKIIESRQKESASQMKKPTAGLAARLTAERLAAKAEESRASVADIASQFGSTPLLNGKRPVQGLPEAGNGMDLVDARYKGVLESKRREIQPISPEGIASLTASRGQLSVQQLANERAKRAIGTAPPAAPLPAPAVPSRLEAALAAARARRGAAGPAAAPNTTYEEALAAARARKAALGGGDRRKTLRYPIPSRRKTRRVW